MGALPRYHVWTGMSGARDERGLGGGGGTPIDFMFETPDNDDGYPDQDKDYDRLEFFFASGNGQFVATLRFKGETTPSVTLPIAIETSGPKYDSNYLYDNGTLFAEEGIFRASIGLPRGSIGRSYRIRLQGSLSDDSVIQGYALDRYLLPRRQFSGA